MEEKVQHHIRCRRGDVARYVLLPGDPGRAHKIATFFDDARKIAEFREYVTYTGTVDGIPISVTSTGIGCPSAVIAVEELTKCGADTFIRVGTSGGMQPFVKPGDVVIAQAAIRDEGTSLHYLPVEFPAVASIEVVNALVAGAAKVGVNYHVGVIQSKDSFYGQHEPERMPVADRLKYRWNAWVQGGALASEMECAGIFIASSTLRVRAGGVCLAAGNQFLPPLSEEERAKITVDDTIRVAIEAVKALARMDRGK
ncbi:MAG: uridine phosphorylase [Bacillota bacterium]